MPTNLGIKNIHDQNLPVEGFKTELRQGGQSGELYAHVISHAGAVLPGNNYLDPIAGLELHNALYAISNGASSASYLGFNVPKGLSADEISNLLEPYIGDVKVYTGNDLSVASNARDYLDFEKHKVKDKNGEYRARGMDIAALMDNKAGRMAGEAMKRALAGKLNKENLGKELAGILCGR